MVSDFSFSLDVTCIDLPLIGNLPVLEHNFAVSVGHIVEGAAVGVVVRDDDDALASHLPVLPVPEVVLILLFMPMPLFAAGEVLETCIDNELHSSCLNSVSTGSTAGLMSASLATL